MTLDGPAGSGKSSTAREVARRLGYRHLDSGALYRALTFALLEADIEPRDWDELSEGAMRDLAVSIHPAQGGFSVRVGGREVVDELRTLAVTSRVSELARLPAARGALLDLQRSAGREGHLVADGRDMGTVVFPDADVKIFLVAELNERARRRMLERGAVDPEPQAIREEAERIARRDRTDSQRALSPLRRPDDAVDVDTTHLTFSEQVDTIVERVQATVGEQRQNR